jgi:hypothetical protein
MPPVPPDPGTDLFGVLKGLAGATGIVVVISIIGNALLGQDEFGEPLKWPPKPSPSPSKSRVLQPRAAPS